MYDVVHISDSNESFIFIEMFADFTTFKIDSKHAGFFPFLNICANRNAKKRVVVKTVIKAMCPSKPLYIIEM